jgi:ferredoxin
MSTEPKLPKDLPADISQKIKDGGVIRRIVVDREKCIGAKSCVAAAPGVFELDDKSLAYVADPNAGDDDTIRFAAETCPVLAILLYDEKGEIIFPK